MDDFTIKVILSVVGALALAFFGLLAWDSWRRFRRDHGPGGGFLIAVWWRRRRKQWRLQREELQRRRRTRLEHLEFERARERERRQGRERRKDDRAD